MVDILVLISTLGQHPLPEQPKKLLELHAFKQVEKGGIAGCLGQLQIQCCAECLVMSLSETLQIPGAAAATEDARIAINSNNHWG